MADVFAVSESPVPLGGGQLSRAIASFVRSRVAGSSIWALRPGADAALPGVGQALGPLVFAVRRAPGSVVFAVKRSLGR